MNRKDGKSMNTIYSFHQIFNENKVMKRLESFEPRLNDIDIVAQQVAKPDRTHDGKRQGEQDDG